MSDPTTLTEADHVTPCPECGHGIKWHHDERGCDYLGPTRERGCPCGLSVDAAVAAYVAAARVSTATGDAAVSGDDLRDRVTALATRRPAPPTPVGHPFVSDFAAGWHGALSELRAALAASPAPVVSRPETTVKAEALREAALAIESVDLYDPLTHDMTMRAANWLRERAVSLAADPEAGEPRE